MTQEQIEEYILSLPTSHKTYPFGEKIAVYKANDEMFALLIEGSKPLRLSLKCDTRLAKLLRERYESIMPGNNLDKKHWNTLLLTGQLNDQEVQDLIRHAYELVLVA